MIRNKVPFLKPTHIGSPIFVPTHKNKHNLNTHKIIATIKSIKKLNIGIAKL